MIKRELEQIIFIKLDCQKTLKVIYTNRNINIEDCLDYIHVILYRKKYEKYIK